LLEVVQMAAGETPKRRTAQRTRRVMASMTPRLLARYLNRRRFWIYTVAGEPVQRWE
jgi:hypothetical protein